MPLFDLQQDSSFEAFIGWGQVNVKLPDQNTIYAANCVNLKTVANRKTDTALRPAWDVTNIRHAERWELELENMLII